MVEVHLVRGEALPAVLAWPLTQLTQQGKRGGLTNGHTLDLSLAVLPVVASICVVLVSGSHPSIIERLFSVRRLARETAYHRSHDLAQEVRVRTGVGELCDIELNDLRAGLVGNDPRQ